LNLNSRTSCHRPASSIGAPLLTYDKQSIHKKFAPKSRSNIGVNNVTQNKTSQPPRIGSYPELLRKEFIAALVSLAALFILAALIDAPVGGPADPSGLPAEHVKAPWIFVGIQQMLRHFPAIIAGVILPTAALLIMALAPFSSPAGRRLYVAIFMFLTVTALSLTIWGFLS
jgi:hypothetical protein